MASQPLLTVTPNQVPLVATVSPQARTLVQEPGDTPVGSIEIRQLLGRLISTETATATLADLQADLGYDPNAIALVFADPDESARGWYRKTGPNGVGAWAQFDTLSLSARVASQEAATAAAASAAQAATRALPVPFAAAPGAPFSLDFTGPGAIGGTLPSTITSIPPAQASISGGALTVIRDWGGGDAAGRVFAPGAMFGEGQLRILLQRAPFMIEIARPDFYRLALWSSDGAVLEIGVIDANNGVAAFGQCRLGATPDAGIAGEDVYVELTRGPMVAGTSMILRSWRPSEAYANPGQNGAPDSPGYALPQIAGGAVINEGFIGFSSFPGTNQSAKVRRVDLIDARYGVAGVSAKAALVGRWFSRFEAFFPVMATTRGGSRLRSRVTGTATLTISYAVPTAQQYGPVIDVFINGARSGGPVTCGGQSGTLQSQQLATGLDPTQTYQVELRVRGIEETDDKWNRGAGLLVQDLGVDAGGHIEPWPDPRPKMLWIGDSITEAISARGDPSRPINSGGDAGYPELFCDDMGLQPVLNGFGGTGLLTVGSGGMPVTSINAFSYMNGRSIDTGAEAIAYAAINVGTNDIFATNASAADFQTAASAFLRKLLAAHPSLRGVYWLRPFNDDCAARYAAGIQAVISGIGRGSVRYVDTTGWGLSFQADTVHPVLASHQLAATKLKAAIGPMALPYY